LGDKVSVRKALVNWLDKEVIANAILHVLAEKNLPITIHNAKGLWLASLESLSSMMDDVPTTRILKEAEYLSHLA